MQQQTKKNPENKQNSKNQNQKTKPKKPKPKNYDVEISSILTVYIRIQYQVIVYYLVMNKGAFGGRDCRVPKVRWCGRLECQFSAFWQCDPVSLFSQGECLLCVRWCLRQMWWSVSVAHGVRRGIGFLCLVLCFYCVQTVWCSRGTTLGIIRRARGSCSQSV